MLGIHDPPLSPFSSFTDSFIHPAAFLLFSAFNLSVFLCDGHDSPAFSSCVRVSPSGWGSCRKSKPQSRVIHEHGPYPGLRLSRTLLGQGLPWRPAGEQQSSWERGGGPTVISWAVTKPLAREGYLTQFFIRIFSFLRQMKTLPIVLFCYFFPIKCIREREKCSELNCKKKRNAECIGLKN